MFVLHCRWHHCECHALRFQYTRQYSLCEQLNYYPTRTKCCICTYVSLSLSFSLSVTIYIESGVCASSVIYSGQKSGWREGPTTPLLPILVSAAPRTSYVSAFVSDCKTTHERHSFLDPASLLWRRSSLPMAVAGRRSTPPMSASRAPRWTSVSASSHLLVGRWGRRGLSVCFSPVPLLLRATLAGWVSRRSCCCGRGLEIRNGIWWIGTGRPPQAASSSRAPYRRLPASHPAWCVAAWNARRMLPAPSGPCRSLDATPLLLLPLLQPWLGGALLGGRGGGAVHDVPGARDPRVAPRGGDGDGDWTSYCSWLQVHTLRVHVTGGGDHHDQRLNCPTLGQGWSWRTWRLGPAYLDRPCRDGPSATATA